MCGWRKKKPDYFVFRTQLRPEMIRSLLRRELREYEAERFPNEIYTDLRSEIPETHTDRFRIGLERSGHSAGGYWYCARMERDGNGTWISGRIMFNPDENDEETPEPTETLWGRFCEIVEFVVLIIPVLLIAAGFYIYRFIKRVPKEMTKEEKLVDFMTSRMGCELIEQGVYHEPDIDLIS